MAGKKPSFFIVGAPKCATTALYGYLKDHPSIFMPEKKEPHYFANELSDFFVFMRAEKDYLSLFADCRNNQICGEASVMYLQSPNAVKNILMFDPKAKLIAMVRNPVEAAISMHTQNIKSGHEDQISFQVAWDLQEDRVRGLNVPKGATDPGMLQYLDLLAFGTQLERFIADVPEEQRMIILYDDFKTDTKAVYDKVVAFLGLEPDAREAFPVINPTTRHMSPLLEKRLSRIRNFHKPVIGPLIYFCHRVYIYYIRPKLRPGFRPAPPPKPPESVYEMLEEHFTPEIQKMEQLLGRDLSHWFKYTKAAPKKAA